MKNRLSTSQLPVERHVEPTLAPDPGPSVVVGRAAGGKRRAWSAPGRSHEKLERVLIWDLPLRVVHWGLAGTITAALALGLAVDDDHPAFGYHMLFGLAAGGFVILRLVLAFVGSRHARMSSLILCLPELIRYVAGTLRGRGRRYSSHNPGTSWMVVALVLMIPLLIATGLAGEAMEDVHEVAAYVLLGLIAVHLAGLVLHTIQHREFIARAMIDGRKEAPTEAALASSSRVAGAAVLLLAAVGLLVLFRGYDSASGVVRLPGTSITLPLSEADHGDDEGGEQGSEREDH